MTYTCTNTLQPTNCTTHWPKAKAKKAMPRTAHSAVAGGELSGTHSWGKTIE